MLPAVGLVMVILTGAVQTPRSASHGTAASSNLTMPVDINRASVSELMQVPGMTHVWAERILRFRPYRSKQDLLEEGVLPGSVYRKIKDHVIAHHLNP